MTTAAPPAGGALASLVDGLLTEPLAGLSVPALQASIEAVTPQVARLQGWLNAAAGELDARTGGSVPDDDTGRPRTVAGWLAQVSHSTASSAGSQLRTARLLQQLPLVVAAVLDGVLWAAASQAQAACTACGPRCPDHQPRTFTDTVDAALPGHGGVRVEQACATAAWSGPQTRSRIEALLCDARITRVLLTPTGQVHGFEPLRDSVTPAQRRALAARDITCVARGCTRPPAMCDAHHLRHRADGGETTMDDLVLLCRRHHVLWHLGKVQLHHLAVPWHPHQQQTAAPPPPFDELFTRTAPSHRPPAPG